MALLRPGDVVVLQQNYAYQGTPTGAIGIVLSEVKPTTHDKLVVDDPDSTLVRYYAVFFDGVTNVVSDLEIEPLD